MCMSFGMDGFKALKQIFEQMNCVIDYSIRNKHGKEMWIVKFTYYHRYPIEVYYEYSPSWKNHSTELNHDYAWGDAGGWHSCDTTSFTNWLFSVMETEYDCMIEWQKYRGWHEKKNWGWLHVREED